MIRLFHQADLESVNRWYAARGDPALPITMLPEIGIIEEDTAAGFLYRTDAPAMAMLDSFVSNPEAPLRARATALREIAQRLIELAGAGGIRHIMALCKSRGIERLASRMGLHPVGMYVVVGKELN